MKNLYLPLLLLAGAAWQNASAVKAWPGLMEGQLSDGTPIEYRLVGDEYCHEYVSKDGFILRRDVNDKFIKAETFNQEAFLAKRAAHTPPMRLINDNFPTKGNLKGIVILVEFADNELHESHNIDVFRRAMNEEGCTQYDATGSVRDYFIDQSSGLFTPEFDVYGPVKLAHNMSYYGKNNIYGQDSNPYAMVSEACRYLADEEGVDFSKYDFDEDGMVDFVYIYYAGYAESYGASSNTIWPHASNLTTVGVNCEVSGKIVDRYACSSELKYVSGNTLEGIGTFCHEFSHVLGLPDMYHTSNAGSYQLGTWDVMDQGNYNNESHTPPSMSAFERFSLGWLEFTELDTPADRVELPEMTSSNIAYKVSTPVKDEFFTLENRQQVGWDAYQPGKGLMIIHITYDKSAWTNNFVNSGTIRRYDLVEADGTQGAGEASDLFPWGKVDSFTDYTSPSSLTWDGTPTEKGISMIRNEEGMITFRFMKDRLKTPELEDEVEVGSNYFTLKWQPVEDAEQYSLTVREILDQEENPVLAGEDFLDMTEGSYPNADYLDISNSLDEYLSSKGWTGSELYQAGGRIMIGRYGASGKLQSPKLIAAKTAESITFAASVVAYPGKSVNFTVNIINAQGQEVYNYSDKANKTEKVIIFCFDNPGEGFTAVIDTSNERLFIDNLKIVEGTYSEDDVWSVGPQKWIIDNIEGTAYRMEGLKPLHTYAVSLYAMECNGMHASIPTEEITVTTTESAAIDSIISSGSKPATISYFDMLGHPVDASYKGMKIMVKRYENGLVKTVKVID